MNGAGARRRAHSDGGASGVSTGGAAHGEPAPARAGRLVQFGAGNIGRSFIGQLFARGGYEVVFVDVNKALVAALNRERRYRVVIKRNDRADEVMLVEGVRAVNGSDREAVAAEIAEAAYVATSVGKGALRHVLPVIAAGLLERRARHGDRAIDLIIAENVRGARELFSGSLRAALPADYPFDRLVGLVETSIGKMVPIMSAEDVATDPLWVFAEEYNTLILDGRGFRGALPAIGGIHPVSNIAAYVDRKLFVHNLGHAATAYLGYRADPRFVYIWEPLERRELRETVQRAMREAAAALNREYPADLPIEELEAHIDDLLGRFRNRALGDTLHRVGRDLYRKLDREDRLVGAMLLAAKHELPFDSIAAATRAAVDFRAVDERGALFADDARFAEREAPKGLASVLRDVSRLDPANPIDARVIAAVLEA